MACPIASDGALDPVVGDATAQALGPLARGMITVSYTHLTLPTKRIV